MVEGLKDDRPSGEVGGINHYMHGRNSLNPEGGWNRFFEKLRYASRLSASTQLVNAFNFDLGAAEFHRVRLTAERIEPKVVHVILATKLFTDLSSEDIALE